MIGGDGEIEAGGAVALVLESPGADFAEAMEEHGARLVRMPYSTTNPRETRDDVSELDPTPQWQARQIFIKYESDPHLREHAV